MAEKRTNHVGVMLTDRELTLLDGVVAEMQKDGMRVTRSDVLRIALLETAKAKATS